MWELELIFIYLLLSTWGEKNICIQLQNLFYTLREVLLFIHSCNEPTLNFEE